MGKTTRRHATNRRMRARLRGKLLERRRILLAELHAASVLRGTRDGCPMSDAYDAAAEASDQDMEFFTSELRACGIGEIDRTLEKIAEGTYGICEACEKRIPAPRLHALPTATLCVACQREQEQTAVHESHNAVWDRLEDGLREPGIFASVERACKRA